jgi:putative DNA primase/helicase
MVSTQPGDHRPDALHEIARFCTAIYGNGDSTGQACWVIGVNGYFTDSGKYEFGKGDWRPQADFAYPSLSGKPYREMLAAATESDVYVCPYLMKGDKRTKDDAVNLQLLHKDWDGDEANLLACYEKIHAISGFATMSGTPGHLHIYVPLAQPITADRHRELGAMLAAYLPPGCDKGKKATSDVLRPVGTFNHKGRARGGESAPVVWAIPPTGATIDPDALAAILSRVPGPQQPRTATNTGGPVRRMAGTLSRVTRLGTARECHHRWGRRGQRPRSRRKSWSGVRR